MNKFRIMSVFVVLAMLFSFAGISPAAAAGANVLILADTAGAGTPALVSALTMAGYSVTVFTPEYDWNGSPALADFQCVIHLDGTTYWAPLSVSAQLALVDYVESGHCFVGTQWDGYERANGYQTSMNDLILQGWPGSQQFGATTLTTVTGQAGHPVLAGIGSPVSVNGGYLSPGILYSYAVDPPTVLMVSSTGEPAVIVREFGSGCVVNLAFALNYTGSTGLNDPTIQRLFINSIDWGTSSSCGGNQAPTAVASGPYLVAVDSSISFDGSGSTDPDGDTLTETWTAAGGSVAGNVYTAGAEAGIFDVCLTVNDGTVDSTEACTIVVVYDPSGGFVTGGGWIDSQAGAYKDDESLSGKATFGFVAKYKKGATVPDGNTEFHFQAAGFNFHSGTYEWLVVNQGGANAQFRGEGIVNGALDSNGNAYKFMLWAGDDSTDTFRIRIWSELDGVETVVYDNGFGQELGGGSIVIHQK